jgi:hypothetical protein
VRTVAHRSRPLGSPRHLYTHGLDLRGRHIEGNSPRMVVWAAGTGKWHATVAPPKFLGLQEAVQTIPCDLLMLLVDSNGFERWRIDEITTHLGFDIMRAKFEQYDCLYIGVFR